VQNKFVRDFERIWKKKLFAVSLAQFPRDIGHISQGHFPCEKCWEYCCCWRPYCTDPYSTYNKKKEHKFRCCFASTIFEARLKFFFAAGGFSVLSVQLTVGTNFKVLFSEGALQQYGFGTVF
jgi:hypothetical protein